MQANGTCPSGAGTYVWQSGDTIASVALRFGTTEEALAEMNGSADLAGLRAGERICVPSQQAACPAGEFYTVRRGDTFQSIATAHGIGTWALSEHNPYVDPSELVVGQVLCVPTADGARGEAGTRACPQGYTAGVVADGQTYADLLIQYGISYRAFRLANPAILPDRMTPGQAYCVPPEALRGLCAGGEGYVMAVGETLASVASRFGVTPGRMLRINPDLAPGDFVPGRAICAP